MNTKHSRHRRGQRRGGFPRWARAALLGGAAALLTGCQSQQLLTLGDMASAYNREILWMSLPAIALSIIIFVGVSWALFYTVRKFREENNDAPPAQFHGNNRLETILVVVPVVIVMLLSVLAVRSLARLNPVPQDAEKIDVLGKQFWWNFSYPGAPAAAGGNVTNGNELVLPTGKWASLTITSGDVVHAFWAPNLGGQRNATPGTQKTWQIQTDRAGVYQGNCNVLCGASHANMRFKVIALPPDRYNSFLTAAQAYRAPTPAPGSAEERGYNLFMQGKPATGALACAACHRVQGTPANGQAGPDLSFFGTRRTLGAGMWEALTPQHWEAPQAAAELHAWIKNSPAQKPGSLMPPYDGSTYTLNGKTQKAGLLTDEEINDIAAYLRSLRLPEEANYWRDVPVVGSNTTIAQGGNP